MTNREMTELFSLMLLAWPNAELFRGGIGKLGPTIKLWTASTANVDFWTGGQAVYRLIRTNKFPPSISEFLDRANEVDLEVRHISEQTVQEIRNVCSLGRSLDDYYRSLCRGSFMKAVIDSLGGVGKLSIPLANGQAMWNLSGIEAACRKVIQDKPAMVAGGQFQALPPKT